MLRGHLRDEPREFLLTHGAGKRVPRTRSTIGWLRRRLNAGVPGVHPAGQAALKQQGQTAGIGFEQPAVLDEVATESLITLRAEFRCNGGRQIHGDG
jgi:hypothetical protein